METYIYAIYMSTQVERCGLDLLLLNKQGFTLTSLLQTGVLYEVRGHTNQE